MAEGEFISLTRMNYAEAMDQSRDWDQKSPYIAGNELFMTSDLTENDLCVRMINCSKILDRLLKSKSTPDAPFIFERDFYGQQHYWFKIALPLKLITLLYLLIYIPYRISILLLSILSPLSKFNTVL